MATLTLRVAELRDLEGFPEGSDVLLGLKVAVQDGSNLARSLVVNAVRDDVLAISSDVVVVLDTEILGKRDSVNLLPVLCSLHSLISKFCGVFNTGKANRMEEAWAGNVPLLDVWSAITIIAAVHSITVDIKSAIKEASQASLPQIFGHEFDLLAGGTVVKDVALQSIWVAGALEILIDVVLSTNLSGLTITNALSSPCLSEVWLLWSLGFGIVFGGIDCWSKLMNFSLESC